MKELSDLIRYALFNCTAAAMLAGCGGSQPPIGAPGAVPQSSAVATRADRGTSWMLPEAKSIDLLYIGDDRTVVVYSYPQGKLEGILRHFYIAAGECVDKKGDVYISDYGFNKIFEYAHGAKKRLRVLSGDGGPSGCSIDPTTGNLATSSIGDGSRVGVSIYAKASGYPTTYQDPDFTEYFWCGYDNKGNLFVDGQGISNAFEFAELVKGSSTLKTITLNQSMGFPGGVLWDGKHMAVGSYYPPPSGQPTIYQFAINGSSGTKVGTTSLGSGAQDVGQFWIQGQTLIAPDILAGGFGNVLFYNYPTGGNATKTITKDAKSPIGAVVSLARH